MDINLIRTFVTVAALGAFLAIVVWAYLRIAARNWTRRRKASCGRTGERVLQRLLGRVRRRADGGIDRCVRDFPQEPDPACERGRRDHGAQVGRDLAEYNNPLPRWWSWLFYITILFSLAYLVLYPGLGSWKGTLGWSQVGQLKEEQELAEKQYGPVYKKFASTEVDAPQASRGARHRAKAFPE